MEEEEFDDFEEATYSHPPPIPNHPSPPSPLSTHAELDLHPSLDTGITHPFDPPSALPVVLPFAPPLENSSPLEEESIWPQLEKSSSAHVVPMEPFMLDFSKSYSLSEQINSPITEDFFGTASKQHSEPTNPHLPTSNNHIISSLQAPGGMTGINNNLLFEFPTSGDGMDVFGFDSGSTIPQGMGAVQTEVVAKVEETSVSTDLYAPMELKGANDFDLFTPMAQNTAGIDLQQQVKTELKEVGLLDGGISYFQQVTYPIIEFKAPHFELTPPAIETIEADPVVQVSQVKAEPQDINWMQSYSTPTVTPINEYLSYQQNQPTITEGVGNAQGERKESEEFQFHQAIPVEPEGDPRKESEEFVFETTLQPLTPTQDMPFTQQQDFGQQQSSQPNHQILPPEQSSLPIQPAEEEIFEQPKEEEPIQQPPAPQEEEDQFGDFQETTEAQHPPVNGTIEQDNTVKIQEEYLNSEEGDFYRSRQKELQAFVDSLPDYSFLFAQGFL